MYIKPDILKIRLGSTYVSFGRYYRRIYSTRNGLQSSMATLPSKNFSNHVCIFKENFTLNMEPNIRVNRQHRSPSKLAQQLFLSRSGNFRRTSLISKVKIVNHSGKCIIDQIIYIITALLK